MIQLLETNGAVFNCHLRIFKQAIGVPADEVEYPVRLDVSIDVGVIVATHATINVDPRARPNIRRLIYQLEHGTEMKRGKPFM